MLRRKFATNIKTTKTHDEDNNEQEDNASKKAVGGGDEEEEDEEEEDDDEINQSLPYFSIVKMIRFADLK